MLNETFLSIYREEVDQSLDRSDAKFGEKSLTAEMSTVHLLNEAGLIEEDAGDPGKLLDREIPEGAEDQVRGIVKEAIQDVLERL